ncbi:MAG: YceI family protein [Desulfurellaceae bacterium]|nr:YceI family protein [Desulfurellaceae bacterium]
MRRTIVVALAGIALMVPGLSRAATWKSDSAHASVQFAVRHLMVATVRGTFDKFDVTAVIDEDDISRSSVEATIEVASINTRNQKRDDHLRGPDFFDAAQHPTITFKSKVVEKIQDYSYKVTGELTLMGVTREVVLDVTGSPQTITDLRGKPRLGGAATTTINRTDYGLSRNSVLESGGVAIGEQVEITIDIQLVPAQ